MRILIYAGHPAQYHFFKLSVFKLKSEGHEVILLIKAKDILEDLIRQDGLAYINIQPKNRKNNVFSMLVASLIRTVKVTYYARRFKVNLLLGTDASVAQAGFLLRIPTITTLEDDYEIIPKLAKLTYPFTSTILTPTVCKVGKWEYKKIGYEGYMKLAYLHPNSFTPDLRIKNQYIESNRYCIIRIARLNAHHDAGIRGLTIDLVKQIIKLSHSLGTQVYISAEIVLPEELEGYLLKINQNHIHHVMAFASLIISDSQSMSVESAILGVPSIRFSDFAGKISVLEELEHRYNLTVGVSPDQPDNLFQLMEQFLTNKAVPDEFRSRRLKMLSDKIDVSRFLLWFIENYPESVTIMRENPEYQYKFK